MKSKLYSRQRQLLLYLLLSEKLL